jgi:hypothetical protein
VNLINDTGLEADWCLGFQADGRELVVVAVKATYQLGEALDEEPTLAAEQVPLTKADEFIGEPGRSATLHESDFAHRKAACDVIVNGSAYAPGGKPAERVVVGLRVGPIRKRFEVVGDRRWTAGLLSAKPTAPRPFVKLPVSYDRAYGGADASRKKPDLVETYAENPVGVGFYPRCEETVLMGKPLANTQEVERPATDRKGKYRPMAFGPRSRNVPGRVKYAGTYDTKWTEERAPFWPRDFDERYFQCVPEDQQMPYPKGGEVLVLENMTPGGLLRFRLPAREMPILFTMHRSPSVQREAVVDTVLVEPDERRLMLTWRASVPMKRSVFDLREVVIGRTAKEHEVAARQAGKKHYASLGEAVRDLGRRRSR